MVPALRPASGFPRLLDRREQKGNQDCDDRNDH
jgi:hypothetical protein